MNKKTDLYGKIPPQAIESEEIVIGSILLDGNIAFETTDILLSSHTNFYKEKHQLIYKAFKAIIEEKSEIDITTTTQKLRSMGKLDSIGGAFTLLEVANKLGSGAHVKTHARVVFQEYVKREMIKVNSIAINELYSGEIDITEVRENIESKTADLFLTISNAMSAKVAINKTLKIIKDIKDAEYHPQKLTYSPFDIIFDFSRDQLMWIGAMKKSGKTKTMTILMSMLLKHHSDIAIRWFSMEDSIERIWSHFGAIETGINLKKLFGKDDNDLTDEEYTNFEKGLKKYEEADMDITFGVKSVNQVSSEAMQFIRKRKNKFNIIIIDNFNILVPSAKGDNQNEKESYTADKLQQLKISANENNYSSIIIVLDHLKKTEKMAIDKAFRPEEQDLKGSGRKGEVLTQLISINKPGETKELYSEEKSKGKILIGRKNFNRTDLLEKLLIYELLVGRDEKTNNMMLKMIADLGTMKFMDFKEYVGIQEPKDYGDGINKPIELKSLDQIPQEKIIIDDPLKVNIDEEINKSISKIKTKDVEFIPIDENINDKDDIPF